MDMTKNVEINPTDRVKVRSLLSLGGEFSIDDIESKLHIGRTKIKKILDKNVENIYDSEARSRNIPYGGGNKVTVYWIKGKRDD